MLDIGQTMSYSLEILDQLADGSPMKLAVLGGVASDRIRFREAVAALVATGDVSLSAADGVEVPTWRAKELIRTGELWSEKDTYYLTLADRSAIHSGSRPRKG